MSPERSVTHVSERTFGDSYLRHLHLINSVHIKFLTAQERGYQFLAWVSSDNRAWDEIPGFKLRPDGFLRFRKGGQEFCYFIEVDRGTERGESIRKKIAEYHDFDLSGQFRHSFRRDWFRVLFIVSEESHCKTLLKLFPSDTFWVAPAAEMLSKRLFDGCWMSRSDTSLSISQELDPKRRERIDAQKEAELHVIAPTPDRVENRSHPPLDSSSSEIPRGKIFPPVPWPKVGRILAVGAGLALAGIYAYWIGLHVLLWWHTAAEGPPVITQSVADPRILLLYLAGSLLGILIIVAFM